MFVPETHSKSCIERTQEVCCSKPAVALSVIVALAVAILGALVLVGVLHSSTPFTALGKAIGQTGGALMTGVGGAVALLVLAGRICCFRANDKRAVYLIDDEPHTHHNRQGGGDTWNDRSRTGASGSPENRDNVAFQ